MKVISLLTFRKNSKKILEWSKRGERMVMTYRGKPVCRLEPMGDPVVDENDPFYQMDRLAQEKGGSFNNTQIDKIIYGL